MGYDSNKLIDYIYSRGTDCPKTKIGLSNCTKNNPKKNKKTFDKAKNQQKFVQNTQVPMSFRTVCGETVIPSRKTAKGQRGCDWWVHIERQLVEVFFNYKLKSFRRIAIYYDKHRFT